MSQIHYIGADDPEMHLFESQYHTPDGMCYNSYLILDEKVAVMDTVDPRKTAEWLANLERELQGRTPDYLVVHHMEPDHSGSIAAFLERYPDTIVAASDKALTYMSQFFEGFSAQSITLAEGSILPLGSHTLTFVAAPMVHWPEVLVSYESSEKALFSADGFGKFGTYNADPDNWADEARRYYINICGKYGAPVSALLKKASALDIKKILPLHGPVLEGGKMAEALRLYTIWAGYGVETPGTLIACASIHGGTLACCEALAQMLREQGEDVMLADLCRDDMALAVSEAFRRDRLVLACASYDGDMFPPMHQFLYKLALKGYCNRQAALIENGTWAPCAGRSMAAMLQTMKGITIIEPTITLRSRMKASDLPALQNLAKSMAR